MKAHKVIEKLDKVANIGRITVEENNTITAVVESSLTRGKVREIHNAFPEHEIEIKDESSKKIVEISVKKENSFFHFVKDYVDRDRSIFAGFDPARCTTIRDRDEIYRRLERVSKFIKNARFYSQKVTAQISSLAPNETKRLFEEFKDFDVSICAHLNYLEIIIQDETFGVPGNFEREYFNNPVPTFGHWPNRIKF